MSVTVNLNNVMPDFLREDMVNADKTFSAGKTAVRTTVAFTAPRAITIPLANSLPAGRQIIIDDEIGAITSTNTLTITAAGSDNINGATTFVMDVPYGVKRLITDGVSKWTTEPGLGYTAEDSANKSLSVNADQASNTKYPSVKAVFDWASGLFQPLLTAVNFGSFVSLLTAKTTPVDADVIDISDSAAGGNSKKLTLLNFYSNYISPKIASAYQTILSIASVSDLNTGTDNAKYTTALGLEGSKYLTQKMGKVTATAAGTNTYTASLTPAITSYGGIGLYINFANANTVTNPTLAVDGLSADGFVQADGSAIAIGSLKGYVFVKHNGTAWQVVDRSVGTTAGTVRAGDDLRFKDVSSYRKTGTTTLERWYSNAIIGYDPASSGGYSGNILRGIPFVISENQSWDRIGLEVTTIGSAGSVIRLGLYDSSNCIPTNLIADYETVPADSLGIKTIVISQTLTPGLYFIALNHNSTSSMGFRSVPIWACPNVLGLPATFGTTLVANSITSNLTYTTMPSTFTTSGMAAVGASYAPDIRVRLSSI